jgi:hypothetical protein
MRPTQITVAKHVMARVVGNESVLLNLETGTYFGLDPIGSRVWQLLEQNLELEEIKQRLLAEYEVTATKLDVDLQSLLLDLQAQGLITVGP